jgi:hypothetical protein
LAVKAGGPGLFGRRLLLLASEPLSKSGTHNHDRQRDQQQRSSHLPRQELAIGIVTSPESTCSIAAIYSVCVTDGLEVLQYLVVRKRTASRRDGVSVPRRAR